MVVMIADELKKKQAKETVKVKLLKRYTGRVYSDKVDEATKGRENVIKTYEAGEVITVTRGVYDNFKDRMTLIGEGSVLSLPDAPSEHYAAKAKRAQKRERTSSEEMQELRAEAELLGLTVPKLCNKKRLLKMISDAKAKEQ